MPPRYAYWTIFIDDQPTAFRSGSQEELMPTFKRLQAKHASAKMMWWQNGKLWDSRIDAQEAMRARGEIGRRSDPRQEDRARRPFRRTGDRDPSTRGGPRDSKTAARSGPAERRDPSEKLEWKPKGEDAVRSERPDRSEKPAWKPKGSFTPERSAKPDWKPKSFGARPKADWKPKSADQPEWKPRGSGAAQRTWTPKSQDPGPKSPEKRTWVPKEEYKKSLGIEAKRDKNWRPGGEHKDPRQKYKDAKKAKWGRFKQTIRKRYESKTGKKNGK